MYDLDILESSLVDDEEDEILATEGAVEVAKVLAAVAAALALGAALIVIIRKIKKKKQAKAAQEEVLKDRKVQGELDYCDEMMKEINAEMESLKDQRAKLKKEQTEIKVRIKEINKHIKKMKGFIKPVSRLAKSASLPMDKVAKLANAIQDNLTYNKVAKESADEYEQELKNLFESVYENSEEYYKEESVESKDDFSFSDILG